MRLAEILTKERVLTGVSAASKHEALSILANLFEGVQGLSAADVLGVLEEREKLASTGVGSGVAIPHGRVSGLESLIAAVAISPPGIPFDSIDGRPVHIMVVVLAPQRHTGDHLKVLARVSRVLRQQSVREQLIAVADADAAVELLQRADGEV